MKEKKTEALTTLDVVTANIVHQMETVGLFHYNKLAYLFEYFHIKNFGERFTKECFVKLPHGPVIANYKDQVKGLCQAGILSTDLSRLNASRKLQDDYIYRAVNITAGTEIESAICLDEMTLDLLGQVIEKFGSLETAALEEVVYQTPPVKTYLERVRRGFKQKTGGYVLKDCIKMRDHKTARTAGARLARQHLWQYPTVDLERERELAKELTHLEGMRPKEWERSRND